MARYIGPVCRLCRREGMKLFLKGERCHTEKCAIEKPQLRSRPARQGSQAEDRRLRPPASREAEGPPILRSARNAVPQPVREGQRDAGITGENLLGMLEKRLDNVIYRMGFGTSRAQARQMVRHGHFQVNGRKVNIPSFQVKPGRRDRSAREEQ